MKCCVEIEFAANMDRGERLAIFNVLQVRPIAEGASGAAIDWSKIDTSNALIYSESALGTGAVNDVCGVVYLREENFNPASTERIAEEVTRLNAKMREEGRGYVLVGFGRWGSSNPWLGVPVKWSDISEAKVIVECGLDNFRIEPSQGTHFFQNLTSCGSAYLTVDSYDEEECFNEDFLETLEVVEENKYLKWVRSSTPLVAKVDGKKRRAIILK